MSHFLSSQLISSFFMSTHHSSLSLLSFILRSPYHLWFITLLNSPSFSCPCSELQLILFFPIVLIRYFFAVSFIALFLKMTFLVSGHDSFLYLSPSPSLSLQFSLFNSALSLDGSKNYGSDLVVLILSCSLPFIVISFRSPLIVLEPNG